MTRRGSLIPFVKDHVRDPERYGVVTFDSNDQPVRIDEKPKNPGSNWAITGLYFF
jgi:glucose-1-phosphate thymidylyltransferase